MPKLLANSSKLADVNWLNVMSNEGFVLLGPVVALVDVKNVDRFVVGTIELNESSNVDVVIALIKSDLFDICTGGLKLSSD